MEAGDRLQAPVSGAAVRVRDRGRRYGERRILSRRRLLPAPYLLRRHGARVWRELRRDGRHGAAGSRSASARMGTRTVAAYRMV